MTVRAFIGRKLLGRRNSDSLARRFHGATSCVESFASIKLRHQSPGSALFSSKVAVVGERHSRRLPPQRVHDPGEILTAGEQILAQPDPR